MIEITTDASKTQTFVVRDHIDGSVHEYELTQHTKDTTTQGQLDQFVAQQLISQEEAGLQTVEHNRRNLWGTSIAVGLGAGAVNACLAPIFDAGEYPASTVIAGSGVLAGIVATLCVATGEFAHFVRKRAVPKANAHIQERINTLKRNTDWY